MSNLKMTGPRKNQTILDQRVRPTWRDRFIIQLAASTEHCVMQITYGPTHLLALLLISCFETL